MADQDLLSNLRIRASWGQLENERMSANERSGLYSYLNSYNLGLVYQFSGNVVPAAAVRSEEHTSELQSRGHLVCRLLLEKKKRSARSSRVSRSPTRRGCEIPGLIHFSIPP